MARIIEEIYSNFWCSWKTIHDRYPINIHQQPSIWWWLWKSCYENPKWIKFRKRIKFQPKQYKFADGFYTHDFLTTMISYQIHVRWDFDIDFIPNGPCSISEREQELIRSKFLVEVCPTFGRWKRRKLTTNVWIESIDRQRATHGIYIHLGDFTWSTCIFFLRFLNRSW